MEINPRLEADLSHSDQMNPYMGIMREAEQARRRSSENRRNRIRGSSPSIHTTSHHDISGMGGGMVPFHLMTPLSERQIRATVRARSRSLRRALRRGEVTSDTNYQGPTFGLTNFRIPRPRSRSRSRRSRQEEENLRSRYPHNDEN